MDQLVLLVVVGLISLVNWVLQKAAEKREQAQSEREAKRESDRNIYTQKPEPRSVPRRAATTEDPLKELMDALGLPREALPPQPVAPRVAPEREEEFASLEDAPPPLPHRGQKQRATPRWQPAAVRRPDEKMARLASSFAAQEKTAATEKPRPSSVRAMLADRTSKRHAIVLAEILGPPRGLQPSL